MAQLEEETGGRKQSVVKGPAPPATPMKASPMFADAEAMKEKLRQNLGKPEYDVMNFYYKSGLFQLVARSPIFERITLAIITLNAGYISIDTDNNKSTHLLLAASPFQIAEHAFCFYFTFEWFVRFMSFKRKRDGCKDSWFVFDSLMVLMMVGETWALTLIMMSVETDGGNASGGPFSSIMRPLRLLRLSRMMRMAKLLRAMPELLILIKGMVSAMRSVCFTLLLQLIILYVFGITFVQITSDMEIGQKHFGLVVTSMHTLLVYGTLMDNIGELVYELIEESAINAGVFYIFVLISALTVMNMLIGVLCEVVSAVAATEKEQLTVTYVKGQVQEILRQGGVDQDGDGMISKVEFAQILENAQAARILSEVGVDVFGLVELSDFIFEKEDETGTLCEGQLTFADFMEVVLQLRGSNVASVKDMTDLRKFMSATFKALEARLMSVEERLEKSIERATTAMSSDIVGTFSKPLMSSSIASKKTEDFHDAVESDFHPRNLHPEVPHFEKESQGDFRSTITKASAADLEAQTCEMADELPSVPSEADATNVASIHNMCLPLLGLASGFHLDNLDGAQLPSGLDRVRLELDRLRHHVDAELSLITGDIERKAGNLVWKSQSDPEQGFPVALGWDDGVQKGKEFLDVPKSMQSSSMFAMSPGAELGHNIRM
eukprot:TRINITY_DN9081_c0_g1_i1.p1 TRINITY_DN9081_c0_g1~~TRINITY_DN9081_c0_g1_i1.p1  ORF type:complete len:664 (-),score=140.56 TRINITY_DN9081_c0_g1_i1:252-2243(-)